MRTLQNSMIAEITYLLSSGYSKRMIAKKLGISHTTINRYVDAKNPGENETKTSGRPKKLSEKEIRYMVRNFELSVFRATTDAIDHF